jgi:ribosomal protein S18 acetylase RimI-like enzyme
VESASALRHLGEMTATTTTTMTVQIRRATPADGFAIADLLVREFRLYPPGQAWLLPVMRFGIQADVQQRVNVSRHACLVATNAAQTIVGTVEVGYRAALPWQFDQSPYPYLSNLAVRSSDRGQGIAQQLMIASEGWVQQWQGQDLYLHVMADNVAARQLYLKSGYLIHHGRDEWTTWLRPTSRLFLHKRLAPLDPAN